MPAPSRPTGGLVVLPFLDGPRTVVVVAGEVDGASAPQLRTQLIATLACGTRSLVVDLSDLAGCDPQGVDALTAALQVAEARGVAVSLRGQSPQVAHLLQAHAPRP